VLLTSIRAPRWREEWRAIFDGRRELEGYREVAIYRRNDVSARLWEREGP